MEQTNDDQQEAPLEPRKDDANTEDLTLGDSLGKNTEGPRRPLRELGTPQDQELIQTIKDGYPKDNLFKIILENPDSHREFTVKDELIWTRNMTKREVIGVPREWTLISQIILQAHEIVGHYGDQRTCEYIRRWYWWPRMVKDVREFCRTCESCQRAKGSTQKPAGKLHHLPIPTKPWESIGMDFVGPFPESKGYNYLWVIICRMTSMVHLVPVHTRITAAELSWKYLREVVRLHGLPASIVSDRDSKFTSKWWRSLHKIMGAKLLMSTSFHPQTDGQTERANKNIGQIFRTVVQPDQKNWVDKVDMTEFAINASISETTRYAPFELNGGYMPSMIKEIKSNEVVAQGINVFATTALQNLAEAHDAIIEARVFQTEKANKRLKDEPKIAIGDMVFLSTKNLNIPKNRARKLCPKYVGPYKVVKARPETSTYSLDLPAALKERNILPTFHMSLLRPYHPSNNAMFPNRAHPEPYDFGATEGQEWFVDEIIGHRWKGPKQVEYQVRWSLGDTTWESHVNCNKLAALDQYLELQGVTSHIKLPKKNT